MRCRVAASGAQPISRSNSTASSGLSASVGCGQVAAPDHALRRGGDIRARHLAGLGIGRRRAHHVGARKLHPGAAAVEQAADNGERRVIDAARQPFEVVEHRGAGQPLQQVSGIDDLVRPQMDLHVPAERRDALRQRLDHVDGGDGGSRIELGEADAAHAAVGEPPQLAVFHVRVHDGDAARLRSKLRQRIKRHRVVGPIGRRLHHHGPAGSDALLEPPVLGDAGVLLHAGSRPRRRKARGVVDMHVAVAGVGRRLERRGGGS